MSDLSTHSDQALVSLLANENATTAFTELYNRYWKKLLVVAFSKLNDKAEAEEVVQDVFLGIWKRRQRLEIRHSFHTYIASSVKYEVLRKLAKQQKQKEFEERKAGELYVVNNNVEEWMDYETTRAKIEDTVQQLPEKCRLVFRLSREKGMSEKEIAEELDIAPKTVEAHMTKALKKLRSSLQNLFSWLV